MNSVRRRHLPAGDSRPCWPSRVPLVIIESREEGRVIELVRDAAMRAQRGRNWGVFQWTVTEGLLRVDVDLGGAQRTLSQPEQLLRHIKSTTMAGIYVLLDFHPYLENPLFVRTLKDIAQEYEKCARTLVLISVEMKAAAGARAPGGPFRGAPAGQERAPRHRHAHRARMGQTERRHAAHRREGGREAGRQSRRPGAARRRTPHAPGDLQRRRAHRGRPQAAAGRQVPAAEPRRHPVLRSRYGALRRRRRHEEPAPLDPAAQGGVRRQRARTSTRPRACCC